MAAIVIVVAPTHIYLIIWPYKSIQLRAVFGFVMTDSGCARLEKIIRFQFAGLQLFQNTGALSSPVIKCKKTPRKKCSFVAEEAKKR
ncbi:hypothetical protein AALA54_12940, partial [Oscillospiraceae bacterium 44-34]